MANHRSKRAGTDEDVMRNMVGALSTLTSDRLVEEKASDLSQYGLTEPFFGRDGDREGQQDASIADRR